MNVHQLLRWLALVVILVVSAADLWLIPPILGDWALYLFLAIDAIVFILVLRWILQSADTTTRLPAKPTKR